MDSQGGVPQRSRLDSWKQIAAFFDRTVMTVQRWEAHEGLPIHRQAHAKRGTVFAYTDKLEAWRLTRTQRPSAPNQEVGEKADFQSAVTVPLSQVDPATAGRTG